MDIDVPAVGGDEVAPHDLTEVVAVLNALTGAWSTFRLYPNPVSQPAFTQAIDIIRSHDDSFPMTFDVGAAEFSFAGEPIAGLRSGADQLAKRLYLHDIEALTVEESPTAEDVVDLFSLLALDEVEARADGGVAAQIDDSAFRVYQRRTLDEELEEDGRGEGSGGRAMPERASTLAALIDSGADSDHVLDHLLKESEGDNDVMADRYIEGFSEIHDLTDATGNPSATLSEMFAPYVVDDIGPSPTGTFIEVFFKLPIPARQRVFSSFVTENDSSAGRMFLDQFSGEELVFLADSLDAEHRAALLEYANDAAEADESQAAALAPLLSSTTEVREARQQTANYAAKLLEQVDLGGVQHLADEIRAELKPDAIEKHGRDVVRGLFSAVERPDRIRRLARIWASRVRARVAKGDWDGAVAEVEAVQKNGKYSPQHTEAMGTALGRLVNADFVADITDGTAGENKITLLRSLGTPATKRLIELLADEEDANTRRQLLDLLAILCTTNPRPLISALGDDRWYVVRNVAMILGRTGHSTAARHLRKQLKHPDARVRVEVLRALMPLLQEDATATLVAALSDENKRVRYAAVSLLKAADGDAIDEALGDLLEAGEHPEQALLGVVDALAGRGTAASRQALERAAGKKFSMNRGSRAVRNAARAALEGSG